MATTKKATKKAAAKKVAAVKGNGTEKVAKAKCTIGSVAIAALQKKPDAKAALAAVLKRFPEANTKIASIYWYANKEGIRLQKRAVEAGQ
jgi:hypothetical protein